MKTDSETNKSYSHTCVNCQIQFSEEEEYKIHYKSDHHRYNLKRILINLPPLTEKEYLANFELDLTSKSSTVENGIYCEICCKRLHSAQTYKQHLNSKKHKRMRANILVEDPSQKSSNSEFQLLQEQHLERCFFCQMKCSSIHFGQHLLKQHSFPPFPKSCEDFKGLCLKVAEIIKRSQCVFCRLQFECINSAKQHMQDVGHAKLNSEQFQQFQPFYRWEIQELSSSDEQFEVLNCENQDQEKERKYTLQSLEEQRMGRIKLTNIGAIINGKKEIGCRKYRRYYKQYLERPIPENSWRTQLAINNSENEPNWKIQRAFRKKSRIQNFFLNEPATNHR